MSVPEAIEGEFDAWWAIYPRKADKGAARKSYRQARKKASAEVLLAGAVAYRDDPNRGPDRYTKNPSTWLNAEAWTNGPLPSVTGHTRQAGGPRATEDDFGWDRAAPSGRIQL